jgi:hypothetical protein
MNVHKRCQKNVANNCGINPKQIALLLQELRISDNGTSQVTPPVAKVPKTVIQKLKLQFQFLYN